MNISMREIMQIVEGALASGPDTLGETMNTPVKWKWQEQDQNDWIARFKIGAVTYLVFFEYDTDLDYWILAFKAAKGRQEMTTLKTGTGNAFSVYSTVIEITAAFVQENSKAGCLVIYSAEEEGAPRFRVNRLIAQKIAARIGWNFSFSDELFKTSLETNDFGHGFYIMKDGWKFPDDY